MAGRVLYIDLDTVVADCLDDIAGYAGPFAVLSAEGMANERRPGGLNSSVMSWDASSEVNTVQPVHDLLKEAYAVVSEPNQPRRRCLTLQSIPGRPVPVHLHGLSPCSQVSTVPQKQGACSLGKPKRRQQDSNNHHN